MQLTHIANPVRVNAATILDGTYNSETGDTVLRLSDGRNYTAPANMTARYAPAPGDYLVTQEDGYEYINPKDVFERKYRAGGPRALVVITVQDTDKGAVVSLAAEPPLDMSAEPTTEAQMLVHTMLGALPMNEPADPVEPKPVRHLPI